MRTWIKVTASLAEIPEDWGAWVEIFDRFGIASTEQTDRPPSLSGYFSEDHPIDLEELGQRLNAIGETTLSTSKIAEEEWAESWKQYFKPRRVGQSWVIKPSWESCNATDSDKIIELDPGQAFGTGDHPTTRMCLELMEAVDFVGARVADIGCGSGILSVAAMLAGASRVIAVDVDPIAIEATVENASRNRVEVHATVGEGFAAVANQGPLDVLLSNIISATLINLARDAASVVKSGGKWVVSGIIEENWEDVKEATEQVGFRLDEVRMEDRWVAAILSR